MSFPSENVHMYRVVMTIFGIGLAQWASCDQHVEESQLPRIDWYYRSGQLLSKLHPTPLRMGWRQPLKRQLPSHTLVLFLNLLHKY